MPVSPASVTRELAATLTQVAAYPLGALGLTDRLHDAFAAGRPVRRPLQHPVLLVHGFCSLTTQLSALGGRLAAAGEVPVAYAAYDALGDDVTTSAARVAEQAEAMAAATGAVHLVGHSLGGVVSRTAVEAHLAPAGLAAGLVTLGSPHLGIDGPTGLLMRVHACPSVRDMAAGSAHLRRLDRLARANRSRGIGPALEAAYAADDDRVVPARRASIPTPGALLRTASGHGHLSIVGSRAIADAVARDLVQAEAARLPQPLRVVA